MHCSVYYFDKYETNVTRCFNHLILFFSLNSNLSIMLNGTQISIKNRILIINHSDLYKILQGDKIIAVFIPLFYLSHDYNTLFISHYDYTKIHSTIRFKTLIFRIINDFIFRGHINISALSQIISLLNNETRITYPKIYKPIICSDSNTLNEITSYINDSCLTVLTSNYLSQQLFYSSSYISLIFKRHLEVHFKYYITSLKISLSIPELLLTNRSIVTIASCFGFKSYYNYLAYFKKYLHVTPLDFKLKYHNFCSNFNNNFTIDINPNNLANYFHQYDKIEPNIEKPTNLLN